MRQAAAVLMLVAMLTTLASTAKPLNPELAIGSHLGYDVQRVENGHRNRAGVDASISLSRGDTLNSMTASFVVEAAQVFAFYLNLQRGEEGMLSGIVAAEPDVSGHQVNSEELRIFSALGGANFDNAFHDSDP